MKQSFSEILVFVFNQLNQVKERRFNDICLYCDVSNIFVEILTSLYGMSQKIRNIRTILLINYPESNRNE